MFLDFNVIAFTVQFMGFFVVVVVVWITSYVINIY